MTRDLKKKDLRPFSEKHPKWNRVLGFVLLLILLALAGTVLFFGFKYLGIAITNFLDWLKDISSSFDAVVIVALITGTVSIITVVISSIIAKSIEYRKQRRAYLAQKREKSYGAFVEMVYKIQMNSKNSGSYTEQEMTDDIRSFSQELTLWGSKKVADKWVQFRLSAANPKTAMDNLFLLEQIMNEMRKDLGVKRVKKGKLLSFFVNDIDTVMRKDK